MARSKPKRTIELSYASVTEVNNSGLLYPCLIGPRYAVHSISNGVAPIGEFVHESTLSAAYPNHVQGNIVDHNGAVVKLTDALLQVGENLTISGVVADAPNSLIFSKAVAGDNVEVLTSGYNLRTGDVLNINGTDVNVINVRQVVDDASASIETLNGTTASGVSVDFSKISAEEDIIYIINVTSVTDEAVIADVNSSLGDMTGSKVNGKVFNKGTATVIGTKGATITFASDFAFNESDLNANVLIVRIVPAKDGEFKEVYVDQNISELVKVVSAVKINAYTKNLGVDVIILDDNSYDTTPSGVTLKSTLSTSIMDKIYPIKSATVYVEYREQITEDANTIISGSASNLTEFVGEVSPENPLAMMTYCAQLVGTSAFYVIATAGNSVEDYTNALDIAFRNENVFAPITFSQEPAVIAYAKAKQGFYNSPEMAQFKKLWLVDTTDRVSVIYKEADGVSLMLTSKTIGEVGEVTFAKGNLITAGVIPGDTLVVPQYYEAATGKYIQKSFVISKVTGINTLTIKAPDVEFKSPVIGFIERKLSNTEYAIKVANAAAACNSPYINYVWADHPVCEGFGEIGLIYLAVTLAALRAVNPPHAPLSDVTVPGWSVADKYGMSDEDLDIMNNKGVWIVFNDSYGFVVTRHQLTTAQDGTLAEEDSAVSNACNIVRSLRSMLYKYRGNSNVQSAMIDAFYLDLVTAVNAIKDRQYSAMIGAQLNDFVIKRLEQDPDNASRLIVDCDFDVPEPFLEGNYKFNII
jgi:hypothetical protein